MIEKELVTMKTEVWRDENKKHRYLFRRQWESEKDNGLAMVVTIRPTNTSPFITDLSLLLIEENVRKLEYSGFIAVNLFSSIHTKNTTSFEQGIDGNTLEVIQTALGEKRISTIIFSCGSITSMNKLAYKQAERIYSLLSAKQKKQSRVLLTPSGTLAHPLNVHIRKEWVLGEVTVLFQKETDQEKQND